MDLSEQVDRVNEFDIIKILYYYKDFICYSIIIKILFVIVFVEVQYSLFGDFFCDIYLCFDVGYIYVGGIGFYFCVILIV